MSHHKRPHLVTAAPATYQPARARQLLREHQAAIYQRTDILFGWLLVLQWIIAIGIALFVSPLTWIGDRSSTHAHVAAAIAIGGIAISLPVTLVFLRRGEPLTRHTAAAAQMIIGALLIHLTGGRIETHFHIFGSLALLAFYRDWKVIITGSIVMAIDHIARGLYWPQSVFGSTSVSQWRWLEHTGWVAFIDIFLIRSCIRTSREMNEIAVRQAESEFTSQRFEARVNERTAELHAAKIDAEESSRVKSDFLANMSHEIRTPMTAILGYTDLLADEHANTSSPETRREYLRTIQRNGQHLLALINDILDLSKIEAGHMTVERIPTNPLQILFEVDSLMQVKSRAKGITLTIQHLTPLPQTITSDPLRLRQILMNLVGNAVKFTESGMVTIRTSFDPDTPQLRFEIIDTGIGMTDSQQTTLFEAFTQADSSTTRRFGGTGLGLRISRSLAHQLGGDITMNSSPGTGSSFTLHLTTHPVDPASLIQPQDASKAVRTKATAHDDDHKSNCDEPLKGLRIFYAEDGPDNQRLVSHYLRKAGAEVTIFDNGRECLDAMTTTDNQRCTLRSPPPCDLVLTDMQMPEMDGYSLTRSLRALGWPLPIIALTAHAMENDEQLCIRCGCNGYASKPIDRNQLISLCRTAPQARNAA
ncbi:MAG: ATP-binding protein [Phycisphaerales bacterium JB050]